MFYSNTTTSFEKTKEGNEQDSFFRTDTIFTGDYWDEFSLFGSDRPLKTLVIGCGNGACIRPILSSAPGTDLTLIDIDKKALETTEAIYQEHFPKLKFKTLNLDASNLEVLEGGYDLIWLDIYTDKGYLSFLNFDVYFSNLKSMLSKDGLLAINAFTTPTFFAAESLGKAESLLLKKMKSLFEDPQMLPYRRNITIFSKPWGEYTSSNNSLKPIDQLIRKIQRVRIAHSFEIKSSTKSTRLPSFNEINSEMQSNWKLFEKSRAGTSAPNSKLIHEVLLDSFSSKQSILSLFDGHDLALPEIPVLMAAFIRSGCNHHSLYLESLFEVASVVIKRSKNIFIHYYLPQIAAISANTSMNQTFILEKFDSILAYIEDRSQL